MDSDDEPFAPDWGLFEIPAGPQCDGGSWETETCGPSTYAPVFPFGDTGRHEFWQPDDLTPLYKAFWEPYWHCEFAEQDVAAPNGNSASLALSSENSASKSPSEEQLMQLILYLMDNITNQESFIKADTILLLTDTNLLTEYPHWVHTSRLLRERVLMYKKEQWCLIYVPLDRGTGLENVHYTWGATFVLEALMAVSSCKNYVVWDHDAAPTMLYEIDDLLTLTLRAQPRAWEDDTTVSKSDIAIVGITEGCSPVNAGIIFFLKSDLPQWADDPHCPRDACSRLLRRRERLVEQALHYQSKLLSNSQILEIEARWTRDTEHSPFAETPLHMAEARSAADFAAIWAILGSALNNCCFEKGLDNKFAKRGSLGKFSAATCESPRQLTAWAGIMFEQGTLSLLSVFQSRHALVRMLPGDFGFMIRSLSVPHLAQEDLSDARLGTLPPVNVHGYGRKGKEKLHLLDSIHFWFDVKVMTEANGLRPCFLAVESAPIHVLASPGIKFTFHLAGVTEWNKDNLPGLPADWTRKPRECLHPSISRFVSGECAPILPHPGWIGKQATRQSERSIKISCPGLGGSPLEEFCPDLTIWNSGIARWFGPAVANQDVVCETSKELRVQECPTDFGADLSTLAKDPILKNSWQSLPGMSKAANKANSRAHHMPAHLLPPDTSFLVSLLLSLYALRGSSEASNIEVRGFSAGSYTAGLIAAALERTIGFGNDQFLLTEARIGALNFPPRILHWLAFSPKILLVHLDRDELSKVETRHLDTFLKEARSTVIIQSSSSDKHRGYGNHGYSAILPALSMPLQAAHVQWKDMIIEHSLIKPMEALGVLLPYLGWLVEIARTDSQLAAALTQICCPGVGRFLSTSRDFGAQSAQGSAETTGFSDLDFPVLEAIPDKVVKRMALDSSAKRWGQHLAQLKKVLARICKFLTNTHREVARWILGFVVPFCLAESHGESRRIKMLKANGPPPQVHIWPVRRLDEVGMEIEAKIFGGAQPWAVWGAGATEDDGMNIGDFLIVAIDDTMVGHVLILNVQFAKPAMDPNGKRITDRRKILAFSGALVAIAPATDNLALLNNGGIDSFRIALSKIQKSCDLSKCSLVRARGVPSLYKGIAALEEWQIGLLAGLRANQLSAPAPALPRPNPGVLLLRTIADWTMRLQGGLTEEQEQLRRDAPTLFDSWQRSWLSPPFSLPLTLLSIAQRLLRGGRVSYLQGVPGAGKTHTAVEVILWLVFVMNHDVWWLAGTNAPLDAAIKMVEKLMSDAPQHMRQLIARMPGAKAEQDCQVHEDFIVQLHLRGKRQRQVKCMLITSSSFELDSRRNYPSLSTLDPPMHITIDEAQAFGLPYDALPLVIWRDRKDIWTKYWGVIHMGDPFQPHGASPHPAMQALLSQLYDRAPGIRNPEISFVPPAKYLHFISTRGCAGEVPPWPSPLSDELTLESFCQCVNLAANSPGTARAMTVAETLGLGQSFPALMIPSTVRLHPLAYAPMILCGYTGGITVSQAQIRIGCLHPVQIHQTAEGLRSLPTLDGLEVAGYLWFDTSRLGKRSSMRDISPWLGTIEAVLAYLFWANCEDMEATDTIGIIVTWTRLTGQIQRRFAPAGRGQAERALAVSSLSPKKMATNFARQRLLRNFGPGEVIPIEVWHSIFTTSPGLMAPFLAVGTAIGGAGSTYISAIYIHPAHTAFTVLPAASIVGTTRGKRINVILAPADPPPNSYLGRLAAVMPEVGGIAAMLETESFLRTPLLKQVLDGVARVASAQRNLGYSIRNAEMSFDRYHVLAGWRQKMDRRLYVSCIPAEPGLALPESWFRMPLVLGIRSLANEAAVPDRSSQAGTWAKDAQIWGSPGLASSVSEKWADLEVGSYIRCHLGTHKNYAVVLDGPWTEFGYRLIDPPHTTFYICGQLQGELSLYSPSKCPRTIPLLLHDKGTTLEGGWDGSLADGKALFTANPQQWIYADMVGRSGNLTKPTWTEYLEEEITPPAADIEPPGINSAIAMDEDYSEALKVLEDRRVTTVIDSSSAKGIPAKAALGDEDENSQEAPARFVTHPWVWGALRQYSPLVPWGSIVFSTRAFSKEYAQALLMDSVLEYLPGKRFHEKFAAADSMAKLATLVADSWPVISECQQFEAKATMRFEQFASPIAGLMAVIFRDDPAPSWWEAVGLPAEHHKLLAMPSTWQRWIHDAILHGTEQKLADGLEETSFRQGVVFAPVMSGKAGKVRTSPHRLSGPCVISSVTIVLPLGLIGTIGKWFASASGTINVPGGTTKLTPRLTASEHTHLGGLLECHIIQHQDDRAGQLSAAERLVSSPLISTVGCALLRIPDMQTPPRIKAGIFPVHNLPKQGPSGGTDWLRRLAEACSMVAEERDFPLAPPLLLSPVKEQITAWLTKVRLEPNGKIPTAAPHEGFVQWVRNGTVRAELDQLQLSLRNTEAKSLKRPAPYPGVGREADWRAHSAASSWQTMDYWRSGWYEG